MNHAPINRSWPEPHVFDPAAVPAATRAVTERLRRSGSAAPPLTRARIAEMRRPGGGALAVEERSELAEERTIDGPGGAVGLRVLAPGEARACYVHLHGGGWALGGPDRQDRTLVRFARAARLAVVAVDYRLAPEHPHPAALVDCLAAIRRLAEHELGAGGLIVGGESAGAHLAALALLALRDAGELGPVVAANLAYGVYDLAMTPSARRWGAERIVVNTQDLAFFAAQYAAPERHRDPDVSPLYADLSGLPPALFSCGTCDPLLDDTLFMAARWQVAGCRAELAIHRGAPHEFLSLRDPVAGAADARARMVRFVEQVLDRGG